MILLSEFWAQVFRWENVGCFFGGVYMHNIYVYTYICIYIDIYLCLYSTWVFQH